MKRIVDVILSCVVIVVFGPLLLVIAALIKLTSPGPVFYRQGRVGLNGREFLMLKFRTMYNDADKTGVPLTLSNTDQRITATGRFLRKYKLDELPQFFNVLEGTMSIVGPRPEVKKYVALYSAEQLKVLSVLPGITDFASIRYNNEAEELEKQEDPETYYIQYIMPEKIRLNQRYLSRPTLANYFRVIFLTIGKILSPGR